MKKILIVAYHYPPVKISSAVQRTLKFTQYLLNHNWLSTVITINPIAAISCSDEQMGEIPKKVLVKRAFALDTAKHLSYRGRYFQWLALPDRWVTWTPFAIISALKTIIFNKPDVIFSTYPMATAHLIGLILHKLTGIPWVADFRDSMTEEDYPTDPKQRKVFRWLEAKTIKHCSKAVFTTEGAVRMYKDRYPGKPEDTWHLLPNGYDESNFINAEQRLNFYKKNSQITLIHSGVIYPSERDPVPFLKAISLLKQEKLISASKHKIILRATGHDDYILPIIKELGIDDMVFLEPAISYEDALIEMLASDGLILLQASNCNHQIPAKIYEYFRSGKPILALTDKQGDTARLLSSEQVPYIYPLDDWHKIKTGLGHFISDIESGNAMRPDKNSAKKYNREARTNKLAEILNSLTP